MSMMLHSNSFWEGIDANNMARLDGMPKLIEVMISSAVVS